MSNRAMATNDKWTRIDTVRGMVDQHAGFLVDDYTLKPHISDWLYENCQKQWYFDDWYGNSVQFQSERDATIFKLVWCSG